MNLLIVLANPNPRAFSRAIAERLAKGLLDTGRHTSELADLAWEDFDPRMLERDLSAYRGEGQVHEAILFEQQRVDRADALALVFPVYWWSMPALLKGWIDRVFTGGWAYDIDSTGKARGRLTDRPTHLLAISAADLASYERHDYRAAMAVQIERGIFHFCGLRSTQAHLLVEVEHANGRARAAHLEAAYELGRTMFPPAVAP
ncbi:MAG TPA: NAD(P)H-dependent oxidoreductase [Myxococcaceae bacterium]|nr:NAD(P)H-dependent oxidoreductase [Myxococcaceae bacterium]